MAWHELPLMFFTVLAQTTVGAFIVMGFVLLNEKSSDVNKGRIVKAMFVLWVLLGAGFALSTGHLGSPLRAFNALNRVGSSWLSNEIFFGSLFFAAGGFYWLLEMLNKGGQGLRKALLLVAMALGVVFMYAMIKVYLIDTVPTWNTAYTPIGFIVTVILSGGLCGQALLTAAGYNNDKFYRALSILGGIVVVVSAVAAITQVTQLGGMHTAIASAHEVLPSIGLLKSIYVVLLAIALAFWMVPSLIRQKSSLSLVLSGTVLVFLAEFLNRAIFYSLYMNIGL